MTWKIDELSFFFLVFFWRKYIFQLPMKYLFLLLLIPEISIGKKDFPKANIKRLPVERAMNSLVMVTASSGQTIVEAIGFIAKDLKGNVGVVTSFGFLDKVVYIGAENSILVYNKANRFFRVKEVKNLSPLNNLIFLKVKGDLTEKGNRIPLSIADSHSPNEQLFYALRETANSSHSWFQARAVQKTISLPQRLDFLIEDSYVDIKKEHKLVNIPVFNRKGEILSLVSDGADHTLHGIPFKEIKAFLQSSENGSCFIRGCVIEARRTLYKKALSGDSDNQASYMLMFYTSKPLGLFEEFARSIGITRSARLTEDSALFHKKSVKWNARFYYYWLTSHEGMPKKKRSEHFEFLERESSIRGLAEQGHPHFQYLMGHIYLYLDNSSQAKYWFKKSAENGYIPGLWETIGVYFGDGLSVLNSLSEGGYIPAYRLLGLLRRDLRKVKNFFDEYNEKGKDIYMFGSSSFFPELRNLEIKPSEYNKNFSESLTHLALGFNLLQQFAGQSYEPFETFQRYFRKHINRKLKRGRPIYVFSEKGDSPCKNTFFAQATPTR